MMILKIFMSFVASAALLSGQPGEPQAQYTFEKSNGTLTLIGKGLRKKTFIGVKVYDVSVYAADSAAFNREASKALDSLAPQSAVAFRLKFLRDVTSAQIVDAFKEGLVANDTDPNSPTIKESLDKITEGGPTKEGQTMTFLGLKDGKGETLVYENGEGRVFSVKGTEGFLRQIYSLWFGKMTESRMEELKKSLLEKP